MQWLQANRLRYGAVAWLDVITRLREDDAVIPELLGEFGESLVQARVMSLFSWIYRRQSTPDYGVDGQVEIVERGMATGRLLGVQVKTGEHWFREPTEGGRIFRPDDRHVKYWPQHSLPMFLVLVNPVTEHLYWQALTTETIKAGPRGGMQVFVPSVNRLETAKAHWSLAASERVTLARQLYQENLGLMPKQASAVVVSIHERSAASAELLASYLATGRTSPALVAETLLEGSDGWFHELGLDGLLTVAVYCMHHEVHAVAARAFIRAAASDSGRVGRRMAQAGINLIPVDSARARHQFELAKAEPDAPVLAHIGLTLLELPVDDFKPIDVSHDLERRLAQDPDAAEVRVFRAQVAEHLSDWNVAISHWERALEAEPDNKQVATRLARALGRRATSTSSNGDDLSRAIEIASSTLEATRRWNGPTAECVAVLVRLLTLTQQWRRVLSVACLPPTGGATLQESTAAGVQLSALFAAMALDDNDLVAELETQLLDEVDRVYSRALRASAAEEPAATQEPLWRATIQLLGDDRPEQLVTAASHLATLGVDESPRLSTLVHRGVLPARSAIAIGAIAMAYADLEAGLPALRVSADLEPMAADALINLFRNAGRGDDALQAALKSAERADCSESTYDRSIPKIAPALHFKYAPTGRPETRMEMNYRAVRCMAATLIRTQRSRRSQSIPGDLSVFDLWSSGGRTCSARPRCCCDWRGTTQPEWTLVSCLRT
jgi:tetratricopeptide (TPR) repeat protein